MDTTPNYGFTIPSVDATDLMNPDLWRVPFNQVEDELQILEGAWVDVSGIVQIRTDSGGAAATGTSISWAKYRKVGKTVQFMGEGSAGSTLVNNAAVMLPNAQAGVPVRRFLNCGILAVYGATAPADQTGFARMSTGKDRILVHAYTNGFRDLPATHDIMWNVIYETTT